jgi:hypothetical protein
MQQREWTNIDKSDWPEGPWKTECDKEQWVDEATGLPCLIKRNGFGALCGYVGVSEGHPWFEKEYDDVEPAPDVHGSLTYSDFCQEGDDDGHTICHIVDPGEPDRVWWVGFDCSHHCDYEPAREVFNPARDFLEGYSACDQVYRDRAYVKDQCARLAAQAAKAAT